MSEKRWSVNNVAEMGAGGEEIEEKKEAGKCEPWDCRGWEGVRWDEKVEGVERDKYRSNGIQPKAKAAGKTR